MEAAVATREAPPEEPTAAHDGAAEATRSAEELFQWSGYVHLGDGAEECEHALDGKCEAKQHVLEDGRVGGHFHVWVCLPNQFQIRDIAEKARAARARKIRTLRDPESDSHAILESELDEVLGDRYDDVVKMLAEIEVERQTPDILREVTQDERFEHHDQDMEELRRLEAMSEEERETSGVVEEHEQLEKNAVLFTEELQSRIDNARETERARLQNGNKDEVRELERKRRIESISTEAYLHTYYTWAMYVGARVPTTTGMPNRRIFNDPNDLKFAPDKIVTAIREKISELEQRTLQRGDAAGN